MYGPTGIGVLYGKRELLNDMPPYQSGGAMVEEVSFEGSRYQETPQKFEAGTPPIAQALGLAEAIRYIQHLPPSISSQEQKLLKNGDRRNQADAGSPDYR